MNRDQNLFHYCLNQSSLSESARALAFLAVSPQARNRRADYLKLNEIFKCALADKDDVVEIEIRSHKPRLSRTLILLGLVLGLLAAVSVNSYPEMTSWYQTVKDTCAH